VRKMTAETKFSQNVKLFKVMKATNYTDSEIAAAIGISVKDYLDIINANPFLKDIYEKSQEKLITEIERGFIDNTLKKLKSGDNTDAKWILERRHSAYQKTDKVDVNVTGIDEIIRNTK